MELSQRTCRSKPLIVDVVRNKRPPSNKSDLAIFKNLSGLKTRSITPKALTALALISSYFSVDPTILKLFFSLNDFRVFIYGSKSIFVLKRLRLSTSWRKPGLIGLNSTKTLGSLKYSSVKLAIQVALGLD